MSIPATEAVTTGLFGTAGTSSTGTSAAGDKEMFLQLLVAQMRYQDPMNPTDSSQFLSQSAQFTALEKMQDVADKTAQVLSAQMAFGAAGLVGKQVTWADSDGVTQSGTVNGVAFGVDGPMLSCGDATFPVTSLLSVVDGSETAPPTTDSTTATSS
jgi:flagellar basal-body rod modification protein FlgD